jgi:hypothetical protein
MRDRRPELVGVFVDGARWDAAPAAEGVVVVVTPPGGSSAAADGATGPTDPGSPA